MQYTELFSSLLFLYPPSQQQISELAAFQTLMACESKGRMPRRGTVA